MIQQPRRPSRAILAGFLSFISFSLSLSHSHSLSLSLRDVRAAFSRRSRIFSGLDRKRVWVVRVTRRPGTSTPIETGWAAGGWRPTGSSTISTGLRPRCCTVTWPRPRPSWRSTAAGACGPRGACCWSCRWDPAASRRTPPAKRQETR